MARVKETEVDLVGMVDRYLEIEKLRAEMQVHLEAIQAIFRRMLGASRDGRVMVRAIQKAKGGRRGPRARRAKRGALKAAIYRVLAGGKVKRPAEIVKALPGVGYRSASKPPVLYTSVYMALKKDKGIRKTSEGFQLKAAGKK